MRQTLTALALLSLLGLSPAAAQTTVTGKPAPDATTSEKSGGQQAVTRPNTDRPDANNPGTTGTAASAKLEEGANSFTEAQVRKRLEDAGYKEPKDLKKDDTGIWRGTAMMNGKSVGVGVDFKGNVAVQ